MDDDREAVEERDDDEYREGDEAETVAVKGREEAEDVLAADVDRVTASELVSPPGVEVDLTRRGSLLTGSEPTAVSSSSSFATDEVDAEEVELTEPLEEDEDSDTVGDAGRWRELLADMRCGGTECDRWMSGRLAEAERRRGVRERMDCSRLLPDSAVRRSGGGRVGVEVIA